jgi:hypothetical protein
MARTVSLSDPFVQLAPRVIAPVSTTESLGGMIDAEGGRYLAADLQWKSISWADWKQGVPAEEWAVRVISGIPDDQPVTRSAAILHTTEQRDRAERLFRMSDALFSAPATILQALGAAPEAFGEIVQIGDPELQTRLERYALRHGFGELELDMLREHSRSFIRTDDGIRRDSGRGPAIGLLR